MEAVKNSSGKIEAARKALGRAWTTLGRFASQIDGGELAKRLNALGPGLLNSPETADLEKIFKIQKEVATKVARYSFERAYIAAQSQLNRWAPKMGEHGKALQARMADVPVDAKFVKPAELEKNRQLVQEVFAAVCQAHGDFLVATAEKALLGWTGTEEVPGKYAEPFSARTTLAAYVAAFKLDRPPLGTDPRLQKDWLDRGHDLLDSLAAPWGYFKCTGHGPTQKKVLPIKATKTGKWFVPDQCHDCHKADEASDARIDKHRDTKQPRTEEQKLKDRQTNEENRLKNEAANRARKAKKVVLTAKEVQMDENIVNRSLKPGAKQPKKAKTAKKQKQD